MRTYFLFIKGGVISTLALCGAFLVIWTGAAIIDHLFNKGWGYPPRGWLWGLLSMVFLAFGGWFMMGILRLLDKISQSRGGR